MDFGGLGSCLGTHSVIPVPGTETVVVNSEAIMEQKGESWNYTFLVDVSEERQPWVVGSVPSQCPEERLPYDNYFEKPGRFGPHNQHHYGEGDASVRYRSSDHLVMTWFNAGLRVFDVSNPLAPREAGYYVPEDPETRIGTKPEGDLVTQFEDVLVDSRGNIFCTDKNHGLFVLESDVL
jgi:hypothetical protein